MTDMMPEPPDGTRLVVRVRGGSDLYCRTCDNDLIELRRDDAGAREDYDVPDGEGAWLGSGECFAWSYLAPQIDAAYRIVKEWDAT